jgi:uncharacterized protein YdeI (YjbR/CyaY-like superfamily)
MSTLRGTVETRSQIDRPGAVARNRQTARRTLPPMNSKVDGYLRKSKKWQPEMARLRTIVLSCGLTEELKWGKPCYAVDGKNVVIIIPFKNYCALAFFKGALLKDVKGILIKPGQLQSGRQIRFSDLGIIAKMENVLKAYIREAIKVEKAGSEVEYQTAFTIPAELQQKFDATPTLKKAFEALTPGRQRAYVFYFTAPKQSKTRTSRIEKSMPQILQGKGLNDDYLSKRIARR